MMVTITAFEEQMRDLVNEVRAEAGLAPLTLNVELAYAAELHSLWMLKVNEFSHTGVNNSTPTQRIADAGYVLGGTWTTGENIAYQTQRGEAGYSDDVVDLHISFMNSPGHRANILNPDFTEIGIGIEIDTGIGLYPNLTSVVVTQNFGTTGADYASTLTVDWQTPMPIEPSPEPTGPVVADNFDFTVWMSRVDLDAEPIVNNFTPSPEAPVVAPQWIVDEIEELMSHYDLDRDYF